MLDNRPGFPYNTKGNHSLLRIRLVMFRSLVFNHTVRILSALALLVSVMVSPIRPNASSGVSSPNHLRRNFGVPGKAPASHRPHVPSRIMLVKAVSSETRLECLSPFSLLRIDPPSMSVPSPGPAWASSEVWINRACHARRC